MDQTPQQPQSSQLQPMQSMPKEPMQPSQSPNPAEHVSPRAILGVVVVILVLVAGYALYSSYSPSITEEVVVEEEAKSPEAPIVEDGASLGGVLQAPEGFPQGIPYESGSITESKRVSFQESGAEQLSLSYVSNQSIAQKVEEYRSYMTNAGYAITEGEAASPRSLFGVKEDSNLSVAISSTQEGTLVQVSYLLKNPPQQ